MKLLPYLPLSKPITGADAARQSDADAFDEHPDLVAFVRPMIEGEFSDQPEGMQRALEIPPMHPFRRIVRVTLGTWLFPNSRKVLQVQALPGFDPSRDGVLRDGIVTNTPDRRRRSFQSLRSARDPATP